MDLRGFKRLLELRSHIKLLNEAVVEQLMQPATQRCRRELEKLTKGLQAISFCTEQMAFTMLKAPKSC